MGEEISRRMNLGSNLRPVPRVGPEPATNDARSGWGNGPARVSSLLAGNHQVGTRQALRRFTSRPPSSLRRIDLLPSLPETAHSPMIELSRLFLNSGNGAAVPACEGSRAGAQRICGLLKKAENGDKLVRVDTGREEKRVCSNGDFFDCSICLELSKEPVVTSCGHLYCWPCIYQWLNVSGTRECPVCKGEVSVKTLTPIYGRGKHERESEGRSTMIPVRPQARRIESFKAAVRRSFPTPTDMIRHLHESLEREDRTGERHPRPFLSCFMTSRGIRAEQNHSTEAYAPLTNLISNIPPGNQGENGNRVSSSPFSSAERAQSLMDAYLVPHGLAMARDQVQNRIPTVAVEDTDSLTRLGVINSGSEVDTGAEIDSMLSVPTSSSVRIIENFARVSDDVDSDDYQPLRRRRRLA